MNDVTAALDDLIANLAAAHVNDEPGALPAIWDSMVELGLDTVGVDESLGGSGGSMLDALDLAYFLGKHAVSAPFIEHATARCIGRELVRNIPGLVTLAFPAPDLVHLGPGGATVNGQLGGVPWGIQAAAVLLVLAEAAVVIDLQQPGVTAETVLNAAGEPRDTVHFDRVAGAVITAPELRSIAFNRVAALRAASLAGAVSGAYVLTKSYVNQREQFGAPLVKIPGVAANLAAIKAESIQAEAAIDRVRGEAQDSLAADRWGMAVISARVVAARAATTTARLAHQLHGAIGITAEYPLHRHTRRLWAWTDDEGSPHAWSVALAQAVEKYGEAAVWDMVAP